MKVAVVSRVAFPFHGHGGLERHVGALLRYLAREGCEVTLFTTPVERASDNDARLVQIRYRRWPWPGRRGFVVADRNTNYIGWSLRAGRAVLEDGSFDVVQAEAGAGFGYAYHRRGAGDAPPLVLHPHGMEEFKTAGLKHLAYLPLRLAIRYASRHAERVLVPDASMKDDVARYLGSAPERHVVIHNAIDLEAVNRSPDPELARALEGRLGLAPNHLMLLSVGRLESNKGFLHLVEALSRLGAPEVPWRWVLVGEGPERKRLQEAIRARGLGGRSRLAGAVTDEELAALYERAALFVHPTLFEGSSQVTLEAMAHALPVVATRAGGIPDKVEHEKTGLLVEPGDAGGLTTALGLCLMARDTLEVWGGAGRRRVEERFSWATRVKKLLALYEELIREKRTQRRGAEAQRKQQ